MIFNKKNSQNIWIIAGLGNPGFEYEKTRHNCGFCAIDRLAEKLDVKLSKKRFNALVGEGEYAGAKIILMKPQTYMNNSGEAIQPAMRWYKTDTSHLIILYDDIDIDCGTLRVRGSGSAGTHNGMKSVIGALGKDDFPRVRIGVGKDGQGDLIKYVLGTFPPDQQDKINEAFARAADAALCIIEAGVEKAMNEYNGNK